MIPWESEHVYFLVQNVQWKVVSVNKMVTETLYSMKAARYFDKSITSYNLNRKHSIAFLKLYTNSEPVTTAIFI